MRVYQYLPFRYADQYPWFCSGICSQLYSDPFGDPLAEPVVQTAYYMWLKSDGRRDRRACRRISAFVACRIYSQLFTETPMGQMLEAQVNSSIWLSLIYRYNLMNVILGSIINGIL